MVLRGGDTGDAVKTLQRGLNRLGSMLLIDGDFGAGTSNAVLRARETLGRPGPAEADDDLQQAVAAVPDPCQALTAPGMTFIAREEVSDADSYRRLFQKPTCPPPPSGITIGIGYDCQFVDRSEFEEDWADILPADVIAHLADILGKAGSAELADSVSMVMVPLTAAMQVFATR